MTAPAQVRLGEIARIFSKSVNPQQYPTKLFAHYSIPAFDEGSKPTSEVGADIKSNKTLIPDECVLFSKLNPRINRVWHVQNHGKKTQICSTEFVCIIPDKYRILPEYLMWFLRSPDIALRLPLTTSAATKSRERISPRSLLDLTLPLPPLDEQRRIVDILNHASSIRRLREQAQAKAREIIPALFLDMFGDPATNPKGWRIAKVGDVYSTKRLGAKCGPFGSALKKHEYVADGIPVWGIDNVAINEFVETGSLFITEKKYEELKSYSVMTGDILVSRAGTVGRMCVARPKALSSVIGTNLIRLALNEDLIIPEFFSTMFSYFAQRIGRFRATGEDRAYSFMKTSVLKAIEIPLPPIAYQREFAQSLSEIAALGEALKLFAFRSNSLTEALLNRAFNDSVRSHKTTPS